MRLDTQKATAALEFQDGESSLGSILDTELNSGKGGPGACVPWGWQDVAEDKQVTWVGGKS